MGRTIDIRAGDRREHIAQALEWINAGFVIAAPLENGYAFLTDAFSHDAVRAMHVLRGDELGVVAQVLISGEHVLDGIAREVSPRARVLMKVFWPGLLTFNLPPQRGLTWDLGDNRELDEISVRVPNADFVLELLHKSGPLAVSSAARAGGAPVLDASSIAVREWDLAGIFNTGELPPAPVSTIVSDSEIAISVLREGFVTLEQLREHLPDISSESSAN